METWPTDWKLSLLHILFGQQIKYSIWTTCIVCQPCISPSNPHLQAGTHVAVSSQKLTGSPVIGRSPNYFPWPTTPWSHTLLPLEPSVCFVNCIWQAKDQAIHVKCEGEAFHSPLTVTIWFDIGAPLNMGVFKGSVQWECFWPACFCTVERSSFDGC